ncbi:hypothetical protein WHX54_28755 [Klebsiella michiganensis]|uniref:hypothetical protein n=1 Tax=Klebsiella michiganensis TaxID=1134687 RepID=UPI0012B72BC6|nr:hypothetical protein [Klebsiella michiganensis]ELK6574238.1 hypothetical protein [Klebsiella michiganensis]CAE7358944.1 hypothetical protein AI2614V1_5887 [Klebsiella oxytoca]CAH3948106.1 hypothetical protein AI2614V1_5887 [Klebsiella oxytoca]HDS5140982.1 hypothetical protein [Klebsiella michiganensis]
MELYGHQPLSVAFPREAFPSCSEPKAEKVIAFHGKEASYAYNVLADLKAAGASYPRRNIIADMFRRLGVE